MWIDSRKSWVRVAMLVMYALLFIAGQGLHALPFFHHHNHSVGAHDHGHGSGCHSHAEPHCSHHCHHHETATASEEPIARDVLPAWDLRDDCSLCKLLDQVRSQVEIVQWDGISTLLGDAETGIFLSPRQGELPYLPIRGPPVLS